MKTHSFFRSVGKTRLSEEVARQIEKAILEGRLKPGEGLPPERELARSFNVSRPILREALYILEINGYITIQQGRGTFVKDPINDILNLPLADWLKDNYQLVEEFYEARLAIEPFCAALASQRASEREIAHLRDLIKRAEQIVDEKNLPSYVALDIDFHSCIAHMSENSYLQKMLESLIVPETDVRKIVLRLPDHISAAHYGHECILTAIEDRDPEAARKAMEAALSQPLVEIKNYLQM
jgi:GntR family transcriptional regulator, transcriptional repressor for pyruvate dehydrogenase complex